ncbi:MAG: PHP domain-containing protein [Clostridia bacterium]|nr:PHP domain-containing protein [Clostridia bacterium]
MIDLHVHSTASDGTCTPSELVRLAKEQNLKALSICDHDTVGGVEEELRAGEAEKLTVIPGVEISCGDWVDIHLLGYFVDHNSPDLLRILDFLSRSRDGRMYKILENLEKYGIHVTPEETLRYVGEDGVTGRPHIARAMVEKGYVPDIPTAFRKYIGLHGCCYAEREKLSITQAIQTIHKAGGIAVLAHGGLLRLSDEDLNRLLDQMQRDGLDGLECYHSSHTLKMQKQMRMQAQKRGLLVTGGSDFHGASKPQVQLHSGLENWEDEESCLEKFLEAGK